MAFLEAWGVSALVIVTIAAVICVAYGAVWGVHWIYVWLAERSDRRKGECKRIDRYCEKLAVAWIIFCVAVPLSAFIALLLVLDGRGTP